MTVDRRDLVTEANSQGFRPIDKPRVEAAVRELLLAIGEDPDREGLVGTPDRVARACEEVLGGMQEDPGAHLRKQFHEPGNQEMVIVKDIPFSSLCEHHILPFTGRAHVCYIPRDGRITGLSKIARCVARLCEAPAGAGAAHRVRSPTPWCGSSTRSACSWSSRPSTRA